jgi:membrane protease subunit HflC
MNEENIEQKTGKRWPSVLLGLVIAAVFLITIFSFQVNTTEYAVVTTFGKITSTKSPGLHFRLPYPIQKIIRYDNRYRSFEGLAGKLEEASTSDGKSVIIGIFVIYKIINPELVLTKFVTELELEKLLTSRMRTDKNAIIGKYEFRELVNTDPAKLKLAEIESHILKTLAPQAKNEYGVEIKTIGIKFLGVPEKNSEKIFERMIAERNVLAETYRSDGKKIAKKIRDEADSQRQKMLADAEAEARKIKAEGDAKAAEFYSIFKEEPELAEFLRKLESLRKILPEKTTLILDTKDYPPFDILNTGKITDKAQKPNAITK